MTTPAIVQKRNRNYLLSFDIPEQRHYVGLGCEMHECHVLRRELVNLPNFAGCPENAGHLLFVSEDIPRQWRRYIAMHEIYEAHISPPGPQKCKEALMHELRFVRLEMPGDYDQYIIWRTQVFEDLLAFRQRQGEPQDDTLIVLDYLYPMATSIVNSNRTA